MIISSPPNFQKREECPPVLEVVLDPKHKLLSYIVCVELPDIHRSNISLVTVSGTQSVSNTSLPSPSPAPNGS